MHKRLRAYFPTNGPVNEQTSNRGPLEAGLTLQHSGQPSTNRSHPFDQILHCQAGRTESQAVHWRELPEASSIQSQLLVHHGSGAEGHRHGHQLFDTKPVRQLQRQNLRSLECRPCWFSSIDSNLSRGLSRLTAASCLHLGASTSERPGKSPL